MGQEPKSAAPMTHAPWVRERGATAVGTWHRPTVWPVVPGALVATICGREVVMDSHANVGAGGVPRPACADCAP